MFTIQRDKDTLVLRPEATASVVRAYLEKNLDKQKKIAKFYYLGPMFRAEHPQEGRLRQFHHLGIEAIGSLSPRLDIEVISLSARLLRELGVSGFQICLNSLGCFEDKEKLARETEGIGRKGLILSSIMKFKQLCNHSDHYIGSGDYNENNSGKFIRLKEICEIILEKRERLLVFTQFREITEPLKEYLSSVFNKEGFILTGSTAVKKRKQFMNFPKAVIDPFDTGIIVRSNSGNQIYRFSRRARRTDQFIILVVRSIEFQVREKQVFIEIARCHGMLGIAPVEKCFPFVNCQDILFRG